MFGASTRPYYNDRADKRASSGRYIEDDRSRQCVRCAEGLVDSGQASGNHPGTARGRFLGGAVDVQAKGPDEALAAAWKAYKAEFLVAGMVLSTAGDIKFAEGTYRRDPKFNEMKSCIRAQSNIPSKTS
jgi:hypothetical protein